MNVNLRSVNTSLSLVNFHISNKRLLDIQMTLYTPRPNFIIQWHCIHKHFDYDWQLLVIDQSLTHFGVKGKTHQCLPVRTISSDWHENKTLEIKLIIRIAYEILNMHFILVYILDKRGNYYYNQILIQILDM